MNETNQHYLIYFCDKMKDDIYDHIIIYIHEQNYVLCCMYNRN